MVRTSGLLLAATLCGACASHRPHVGDRPGRSRAGAELPPDAPPVQALRSWLAAFNAGDIDAARRFVEASFAPEALRERPAQARAESDRWLYLNLGAIDLVRVDTVTDTCAVATVRQRLVDGWGHVTVHVAPGAPHRILSRSVTFFEPAPAGLPWRRPPTDAALVADVDAFARRLTDAGVFSGVVMIAKGGRPVLAKAYGYARREPPVPNAIDTRFQLGSVSKMFTAVAVAQLVEQGRLSFSDTVARLLPDYPNPGAARRITVAHLLTHTAGLPEYFASPRYPALQDSLRAPRDYWPLFAADPLRFAPGSEWEYSNSNYIVLGSLIERVTRRGFRDYIAARVFRPAGMDETTYDEGLAARRPDVAVGYTRFGPGRKPNLVRAHEVPVRPGRLAGPAGGGLSTARDLLRFANALLGHRLLGAAMTSRILEPRVATPDGQHTYGFEWQAWNGVRFVGHNGFADGAFDQVDMYPDRGYTVVVLSNTDMSGAGAIAYRLRLTLTAK